MLETVFSLTALTFFVIGGAIAYGITASRPGKSDTAIQTLLSHSNGINILSRLVP